jgi:hypothetical protein
VLGQALNQPTREATFFSGQARPEGEEGVRERN